MFLSRLDSFGNIDAELLFHRLFSKRQLCRVFAARDEFLRIISAVLDQDVLCRPQIPIQSRKSRRSRRFQVRHRLAGPIRDRDLDLIAREILCPNREERAFRRISPR